MAERVHSTERRRVIIVGAGFGGLQAARMLAHKPVDVLLIDRNNYHGFWPLLYQVATAGLNPEEIAQPVRAIIRSAPNITFCLANVEAIDRTNRIVVTDGGAFPYDEVIIASGSTTNFFGMDQLKAHSFELKDLPDALAIRNQIVTCFEHAILEQDAQRRKQLLTFVVVGGGPTGVELAGAIAELIRHVMRKDYPRLDFSDVHVVLLEAADRILLGFPESLSRKAERTLAKMGVDIQFGKSAVNYSEQTLHFKDGSMMPTATVIWAAGVKGSPLGATLDVPLQRGGRVEITPQLHLPNDPNVWVIGDLAYLEQPDGQPYPGLATVAMQQGRQVAQNIVRKLAGTPLEPFRYRNKGTMATVGRGWAVAYIWNTRWSGSIAWVLWLAVHLWYVIGFRNRLQVLINWAYNYFTYDRGSRALIPATSPAASPIQSDGQTRQGDDLRAIVSSAPGEQVRG